MGIVRNRIQFFHRSSNEVRKHNSLSAIHWSQLYQNDNILLDMKPFTICQQYFLFSNRSVSYLKVIESISKSPKSSIFDAQRLLHWTPRSLDCYLQYHLRNYYHQSRNHLFSYLVSIILLGKEKNYHYNKLISVFLSSIYQLR